MKRTVPSTRSCTATLRGGGLGVRAEVLYTTLGMPLFGLDDTELQQICFSVFNDWLAGRMNQATFDLTVARPSA